MNMPPLHVIELPLKLVGFRIVSVALMNEPLLKVT